MSRTLRTGAHLRHLSGGGEARGGIHRLPPKQTAATTAPTANAVPVPGAEATAAPSDDSGPLPTVLVATASVSSRPASFRHHEPHNIPPVSTPISINTFRETAAPAVHPSMLTPVLNRLEHGADIGYSGPNTSTHRPNNLSARNRPEAVSAAISKEVARGHAIGPFPAPPFLPFRCNPLGARENPTGQSGFYSTYHNRRGTA